MRFQASKHLCRIFFKISAKWNHCNVAFNLETYRLPVSKLNCNKGTSEVYVTPILSHKGTRVIKLEPWNRRGRKPVFARHSNLKWRWSAWALHLKPCDYSFLHCFMYGSPQLCHNLEISFRLLLCLFSDNFWIPTMLSNLKQCWVVQLVKVWL